jgi:2-keto-4-pentenoate hydratase/2-oxohepta-3-ene-1,7-dioic acid hydratase in catechol pathway
LKLTVYGPQRLGLVIDEKVVDLERATGVYLSSDEGSTRPSEEAEELVGHTFGAFVSLGETAVRTAHKVFEFAKDDLNGMKGLQGEQIVFPMGQVPLRAPVTESSKFKIMCIGANFADHLLGLYSNLPAAVGEEKEAHTLEGARAEALGTPQWGFYKLGSNVSNPGEEIQYPSRTKLLDYEGEIALIIGKRGKDIKRSDLLDYVFGYTLFNDFSMRDNFDKGALNFARIKNFQGSGALGPLVTLKDEAPDPQDIDFSTSVNSEVRQRGNTKDMIRGFGEWIEFLSADAELNPGDIIASGTSAGTAVDSSKRNSDGSLPPDRFLKVGDVVEVSSMKIGGTLRNKIVAKPETALHLG